MNKECKKCKHFNNLHSENSCGIKGCACKVFAVQNEEKSKITITNEKKNMPVKLMNEPKHEMEIKNFSKP